MGCSASVSQNSQASRATFSSGSCVRCSMYCRNSHHNQHLWLVKMYTTSGSSQINLPQRCCACEGWVGQLAPPAAWREPCTRSSAPPSPRLRPAQTDSAVTSEEEERLKHCNYSIAYLGGNCFTWGRKVILTFTGASWSIYCRLNTKCLRFSSQHLLQSRPNYPLFFDKHQGCVVNLIPVQILIWVYKKRSIQNLFCKLVVVNLYWFFWSSI